MSLGRFVFLLKIPASPLLLARFSTPSPLYHAKSMTSPADDPQLLAQRYAQMSDEDLLAISSQESELTAAARNVLNAELARRGMSAARTQPSLGYDEMEFRDLVTVRRFRDLPEALLAKGSLESAGIECQLVDDNMVRMDWFISNLLGGVKLEVHPEDVESANEILSLPIPDTLEIDGAETYEQPRCPNCGSLEVSFEELNKPVAYVSASIGLPLPVHHAAWRCHACGRRWEDTDPDAGHQP